AQEDDGDPKENCFCRGARIHVVLTNPATCRKKTASCLFLPPLDAFPKRPICSGGKLPQVAPRPVGCCKSVANPYLVRCGAEAKVIRLQGYPSLPGLIQHHCQPPPFALPRNLFPQLCHPGGDACRGIGSSLPPAQGCSSVITTPALVLSLAANSAASGKPRAHTITPPLVSTGQPSRSHRLMRFSFNSRISLRALR